MNEEITVHLVTGGKITADEHILRVIHMGMRALEGSYEKDGFFILAKEPAHIATDIYYKLEEVYKEQDEKNEEPTE